MHMHKECPILDPGGIVEEQLEGRRQVDLRAKQKVNSELEDRWQNVYDWEKRQEKESGIVRPPELARQEDLKRQAQLTRQQRLSGEWARVRLEELSKQNVPTGRQSSAPRGSTSQDVARRYVGRELDMRERSERREEGYKSNTGHLSQVGHSSQMGQSSQTGYSSQMGQSRQTEFERHTELRRRSEHAGRPEHTNESERRRPPQDAKQSVPTQQTATPA
ncbi:hypothetical protein EAE96_000076 [Botrytis aclada]|nr:hypothetical protein EAE96_000076 [Botrytis aclada]